MRPTPLCLALLLCTAAVAGPHSQPRLSPTRSRALETKLLNAVREVGFDQVRDWRHKGERIAHPPNVDVAVIELDAEGRPVAVANVLLSRDYPKGRAVPIEARTLGTQSVRFTKWDLERWDGQKPWADAPAEDELVPMIVESDNGATEALVKLLHERGAMEGLNAEYAALGLGTLQVNGTSPVTGRNWQPGSIHMTALDTARLFLLINGGPGVLWRTKEGRAVTAAELSEPARNFLKRLLAEQGYAEGLSSTLVCGDANARRGIPTAVPARWLGEDGTATVGVTAFKRDTRPCNAAAEVEFLHKTGQTENYGSDAGIVRALPGKGPRHYVIAFLSNLGYRYYDEGVAGTADFADEENGFPGTVTAIGFTQSIAELGRRVDDAMKQRGAVKR